MEYEDIQHLTACYDTLEAMEKELDKCFIDKSVLEALLDKAKMYLEFVI